MQQGSARPCAVKYISDHGRRQAAHARSSCRSRLSPGSVAPEASRVTPSGRAISCAASITRRSASCLLSKSELAAVAHNAVEEILATDFRVGFTVRGIERDAQLVESGVDKLLESLGLHQSP